VTVNTYPNCFLNGGFSFTFTVTGTVFNALSAESGAFPSADQLYVKGITPHRAGMPISPPF
jgi:hypothetical protein